MSFDAKTKKQMQLKKDIIQAGKLLWEKNLVSGLNGNISARLDEDTFLITAHKTCLGFLNEEDIIVVNVSSGKVVGEGEASSETLLHREIYRQLNEVDVILHTHTTYTNAHFSLYETLEPVIFEAKFYLGPIKGIEQTTPSVTDPQPVVDTLKNSSIAVLRNHGVVAVGKKLLDCFLLIQVLEDAAKINAIREVYLGRNTEVLMKKEGEGESGQKVKEGQIFPLFSKEQIEEIVRLVNNDPQMKELGEKTAMTMDLAVRLDETGRAYKFQFENGHIKNITEDENAEFVISASEQIWRAVFRNELDPFVATTQKKMTLKGDFAKISKWYAPCSRIFELWTQVPIE